MSFKYLSFTGQAGSYAELPLSVLPGATEFTIEVKLSTTSTKSNQNAWEMPTIVGRELGGNAVDDGALVANGGQLCYWCSPKSVGNTEDLVPITTGITINDGAVHKVAVVSSNGAIYLYCDGELVASKTNVNAKISASEVLYIATSYPTSQYAFLQMDLYEARFWSTARTQEQIFAAIDGTETGLQAWYLPSQGALNDYSGNGRHATLYGNPAYTEIDFLPVSLTLDVQRKVKNNSKLYELLKAWLPFDDSTTEDLCGNTWTAVNNPTISANGAISVNALQLTGNNYIQCDSIASQIGDDIWTIHWYANCTGSQPEQFFFGAYNANYGTSGVGTNKWVSVCYLTGNPRLALYDNDIEAGTSLTRGQRYHYALSYDGTNLRFFIDGQLKITKAANVKLGGNFRIGADPCRSDAYQYFTGSIDEFCILKGVAWTENFTPPTADDYFEQRLALTGSANILRTFDVARRVKNRVAFSVDIARIVQKFWRYVNLGTADDLITSGTTLTNRTKAQSITGTAFYQTTGAKCFDLPATPEIWLKFDVYFNGSNRWRAYNGGANGVTGVTAQTDGQLSFFSNDLNKGDFNGVCKKNQLQTVLLHMISGSSAGVVEAWVDGTKIYTYTGNVNNGEDFVDIYLQSDGSGTFFSNVLISNARIGLNDGYKSFSADVAMRLKNRVQVTFDVARRVKNRVAVQFTADVARKIIRNTNVSFAVARHVRRSVSFIADVAIRDVIRVSFTADVVRALSAKLILFPINNSLMRLRTTPQNTQGLQSFEVNIGEQQITEQINFAGIIPFDILQQVNGQYLDYHFNMRVEKVQYEGIIYRYECCSDLDQLLFTQLAYKIPPSTWRKVGADDTTVEIQTYYPPATAHVQKIASALGLTPVIQFDDYLSTVLMDDLGGVTYNDLIRDVFGWSSRIPHQLINCYIRDGKLFVVQRGHEAHLIDISDAKKTMPVVTKELVRTTWGSTPWSKTQTTEFQHTSWQAGIPDDVTIGGGSTLPSGDDQQEQFREVSTKFSGHDYQGNTTYTYDRKGLLVQTFTHVEKTIKGSLQITNTTVTHGYDDDNTMIYTSTFVQSYGIEGESSSKSIEEKGYVILPNGEKFLAWEHSATYQNDEGLTPSDNDLVDSKVTVHSPSRVGQTHTMTINTDGEIIGSAAGQNTGDDRVTPFSKYNAAMLGKKLFASNSSGSSSSGQWTTDTETYELINNGLSLYDSSFPIHDEATLIKVTQALRWLNRKTQETLLITLYEFPHLFDFNDRIIFNGNEYFLVNNTAMTTPRVFNEQNLTLRRWY